MRAMTPAVRALANANLSLLFPNELVVDNFAGGGGASTGIEQAFTELRGAPFNVNLAINHDPEAIAMHTANHPHARHFCESVFKVDPEEITGNQPVGLAWFSPDCTHHSKARGGKPKSNKRRGLAWVVIRWARRVKPRVIMLENVEEFQDWGPLDAEGAPIKAKAGTTFRLWVNQLIGCGYKVEWRQLRACDYGAPTTRRRLFVIARRDGHPIKWPSPTHGPRRPYAYRTAAECIDWSIPVPSIFDRARGDLAEATQARIAAGIQRYVIDSPEPFIVPTARGAAALSMIQTGYGEREGQAPRVLDLHRPLGTVVCTGNKHALVAAFLAQHNTGMVGHDLRESLSTIVGKGSTQMPVTVTLADPEFAAQYPQAGRVYAFLMKFYGNGGQWSDLREPMHTATCKARMALVTVTIDGTPYAIVDIGMRMLEPRELFNAQGFPPDYVIDRDAHGNKLTKTSQYGRCGNAVCPPLARALVKANFAHEYEMRIAA